MCNMLSSVVIERIDNWSVELSAFDNDQLVANCTIGVSSLFLTNTYMWLTAIFSG